MHIAKHRARSYRRRFPRTYTSQPYQTERRRTQLNDSIHRHRGRHPTVRYVNRSPQPLLVVKNLDLERSIPPPTLSSRQRLCVRKRTGINEYNGWCFGFRFLDNDEAKNTTSGTQNTVGLEIYMSVISEILYIN